MAEELGRINRHGADIPPLCGRPPLSPPRRIYLRMWMFTMDVGRGEKKLSRGLGAARRAANVPGAKFN